MSFLVEFPRGAYPANAMAGFGAAPGFTLDNARALMWMSQLAYETAHADKIADILTDWGLERRELVDNGPALRLPLRTASAVVASGRGATIVAFAGTDPLKINDWITDLSTLPSRDGIHTGFRSALNVVWPRIRAAITSRPGNGEPLFFTGHSLGGALAIVAAARALEELEVIPTAIYTYGSPRPGRAAFADIYALVLGEKTFRLINGSDLVPTVPPSGSGFRHVGRPLQCTSDGRFDANTELLPAGDDAPAFLTSLFASVRSDLRALVDGTLFAPVGEGVPGRLIGLLPRQIREHVPLSYFKALET